MDCKAMCLFMALFFSHHSLAADSILKIINLSTTIENEKFFSYTIDVFKFEQPSLEVKVNNNTGELMPVKTNLILKTDVPSTFPAGYSIAAKELTSTCEKADGEVSAENFAHYILGEVELDEENTVFFDDLEPMDNGLGVIKPFTISFDTLSEVSIKENRCKGKAILIAGLDF